MLKPETAIEQVTDLVKTEATDDLNNLGFADFKLRPDQKRLINRIVDRHGGGILFRSKKQQNIELQVADPVLLEQDGDKELQSRHLFINIDKITNEQHNRACRCVKDGRTYDIRTLLEMLPIEDRALNIPKSKVKKRISVIDKLKYMERDESGNLVPQGPGECVPLSELDDDHVAIKYVRERGFDPFQLYEQFGAAFCVKENPNLPYKLLPGGFRATPQGRIVFFINQFGIRRGWQARRLDRRVGDVLELYHPYKSVWLPVGSYTNNGLSIHADYLGGTVGKSPGVIIKQKYIIGIGVEKNQTLMGFDAALDWAKNSGQKTIGIVEGVLDAARLGPPFCSIMGLQLSTNQAALVANHFDRVIYTPDNDDEAEKAEIFCGSVESALGAKELELVLAKPPKGVADAGDMNPDQVEAFKQKYGLNEKTD